MEKVKEIELLKSLKGDTYFAQLFDDQQIDAMCTNIRNDHPIEFGLNLFEGSLVARENTRLKDQIARFQKIAETVAKTLLVKAGEYSDDVLDNQAEHLIGYKRCLAIKLRSALPLSEEDRNILARFLTE